MLLTARHLPILILKNKIADDYIKDFYLIIPLIT